mgnify:CR=1 FL=1|jgi:hypothetical protein
MYDSFLCILLIYTEKRLGVLGNYAGILPKTSRRFFIFCTKEKIICTKNKTELSTLILQVSISQRYENMWVVGHCALLFTTNSPNKASSLCNPP